MQLHTTKVRLNKQYTLTENQISPLEIQNPGKQTRRKVRYLQVITHERSLEKVFSKENLIRRIDFSILDPTPLDRNHIVHGGQHHHKYCPGERLDNDWAASTFDPVQAHYNQLS